MLTQYQKLRLLTAAGMEEPAEQGGSDGYGKRGGDLPGRKDRGQRDTERRFRGMSWDRWQQKGGTERWGRREGEPGI